MVAALLQILIHIGIVKHAVHGYFLGQLRGPLFKLDGSIVVLFFERDRAHVGFSLAKILSRLDDDARGFLGFSL
jgi:hypothetical protein